MTPSEPACRACAPLPALCPLPELRAEATLPVLPRLLRSPPARRGEAVRALSPAERGHHGVAVPRRSHRPVLVLCPGRCQLAVPAKGFRSTQISSVGAGVADPPCDGDRWDGLMSAPRDPWWQSRESGRQEPGSALGLARVWHGTGSHGPGTGIASRRNNPTGKVWGPRLCPCPGMPEPS